ncbi:MAG: 3-oxocholest-4-en-26-oate--CoA ligase [Acidimicrobiaceae bacterium]|nr:acyl-CoA synthetase [Acidimicrobiaceae bacterium]CAI8403264.1 MAG: 3-oxocholest-4-en-26-oate--CoA ligase [Acidimicrobiaceae bacterium]
MSATYGNLNIATAWEAISDQIGDLTAIYSSENSESWEEFEKRSASLAKTFSEKGLKRDSKVAFYCYNGSEYLEGQFAAFKIRAIPANVNYRYLDDELAYILNNADAEALLFDSSLTERVDSVRSRCPKLKVFLRIGEGPSEDWITDYEDAVNNDPLPRIDRSGDDLWFLYTGGTTGSPKAVMWSHAGLMGGMTETFRSLGEKVPENFEEAAEIAKRVTGEGKEIRQLCAAPLMHGTSSLTALGTHMHGGLVATLSSRTFDPKELWEMVEKCKVTMLTIVGDAFARPMIDELEASLENGTIRDISSLRLVMSSGVMFSAPLKERLLNLHSCTILDALGSSEGTGMGKQVTSRRKKDTGTAKFFLGEHTRVLSEDGEEIEPGSKKIGKLALGYPLPVGYYKDPEKTEATFPTINGRRWSIPGDWATIEKNGSITLLGRGSECINTGGEKVFPEEVEEALKINPLVVDCNVVGLPDERWGEAVTALVEVRKGETLREAELLKDVKERLAGYKVPKSVIFVEKLKRGPNGKSDYRWARKKAQSL